MAMIGDWEAVPAASITPCPPRQAPCCRQEKAAVEAKAPLATTID